MASGGVNKVILIGNLGADPELRHTPGGQAVCDIRMATNEVWNDKEGKKQERVEWHSIVFWGKAAEILKEHTKKGRRLYVEGRLQTRSWEDKESGKKQYKTEIVGNDFMFLDSKEGAGNESRSSGSSSRPPEQSSPPPSDDDIPF